MRFPRTKQDRRGIWAETSVMDEWVKNASLVYTDSSFQAQDRSERGVQPVIEVMTGQAVGTEERSVRVQELRDSCSRLCGPCKAFHEENGFLNPNEACPDCLKSVEDMTKTVPDAGNDLAACAKCKLSKCNCDATYQCGYCQESFPTTFLLQKHTFVHCQDSNEEMCCSVCPVTCAGAGLLQEHLRSHKETFCEECGRTFKYLDNTRHACNARHMCNLCGAAFSTNYNLKIHLLKHSGSLPYKCDRCPKSFSKPSELARHGSVHSEERPYLCQECGMTFTNSTNLRNHKNTHLGVKPYPCSVCAKNFTRVADVKRHLLTHTGERPFACDTCGLAFSDASNLKKHTATHSKPSGGDSGHHGQDAKTYQCTFCAKVFSRPSELKRHFFTHTNTRPYSCDYCGLAFTDASNLKKHILTHSKQPDHRCPRCDKVFGKFTELEIHMADHAASERHICTVCSAGFEHASELMQHSMVHTGQAPGGYKCEVCSRTFCQEIFLERHLSGHTESRPYCCTDCLKCFKSLSHLKSHALTHSGRKDHICAICSKSFLKKSSLRRHQNVHTKEFPNTPAVPPETTQQGVPQKPFTDPFPSYPRPYKT